MTQSKNNWVHHSGSEKLSCEQRFVGITEGKNGIVFNQHFYRHPQKIIDHPKSHLWKKIGAVVSDRTVFGPA
jgi:hypothetical protein